MSVTEQLQCPTAFYMPEPPQLVAARKHLGTAESGLLSADALVHLLEGLALLDEVTLDGTKEHKAIASNLLATYSARICESVRKRVAADPGLPEPELEHLLKLLLAFDSAELPPPEYVRSLKIDIARRLVERYYEGHPVEAKREALRQLANIAGDEPP